MAKLKQKRLPWTVNKEDERLIELSDAFLDAKIAEKAAKDKFVGASEALLMEMQKRGRKSLRVGKSHITVNSLFKVKVAKCKEDEPEPEEEKKEEQKQDAKKEEAVAAK